ncbi:hypothetical protein V6R21_18270 [Limibacter armeniacum]|uniref:hypothetical protein n=1 Tax=Limibacter armeniacum TaxID=466084 RepID=UPI002FE57063
MKLFRFTLLMLILTVCILISCDETTLQETPPPSPSVPYIITYTVTESSQGTAAVSMIRYALNDGTLTTVLDPTLPWSRELSINSGNQAFMEVSGRLTTGNILLRIEARSEGNVLETSKNFNESNANFSISDTLDIEL